MVDRLFSRSSKLPALLFFFFFAVLLPHSFASDLEDQNLFDENPCAWAYQRITELESDPSYAEVEHHLGHDLIADMLDRIDKQAKYTLGLHSEPVVLLTRGEAAPIELAPEEEDAIRKTFKPRWADLLLDSDPDDILYESLQFDLINTRVAELRYDQEAHDPMAAEVFFGHEEVPAIVFAANLPNHAQASFLRKLPADQPLILLVSDDYQIRHQGLAKRAAIVRMFLDDQDSPLGLGSIAFNTDRIVYDGWYSRRHDIVHESLLTAANSALEFIGRDEVTIEVDLETLRNYDYGDDPLFLVQNLVPALQKNSRSKKESNDKIIRERLDDIALAITREESRERYREESDEDILPDYEFFMAPKPIERLDARYTFTRRDGKKIVIKFVLAGNMFEAYMRAETL